MPDYIPAPDAEFNAWQENFVTYASFSATIAPWAADKRTVSFTA